MSVSCAGTRCAAAAASMNTSGICLPRPFFPAGRSAAPLHDEALPLRSAGGAAGAGRGPGAHGPMARRDSPRTSARGVSGGRKSPIAAISGVGRPQTAARARLVGPPRLPERRHASAAVHVVLVASLRCALTHACTLLPDRPHVQAAAADRRSLEQAEAALAAPGRRLSAPLPLSKTCGVKGAHVGECLKCTGKKCTGGCKQFPMGRGFYLSAKGVCT